MNLFDQLVHQALQNQPLFSGLKIVVEKELLHHDIIRIMSQSMLLTDLTFIGGTCLRTCYHGIRLSEDLDFTGGVHFSKHQLTQLGDNLINMLQEKYGLPVQVSPPVKDKSNVSTWKLRIETRPAQKFMPSQRINIDICSIPSYEKKPMLLINPYGVEMGTEGLVIQAQSREEIYIDKLLAFGLRPNRIKFRDLWDIAWLHQQGILPNFSLFPLKLKDHHVDRATFLAQYLARSKQLDKPELFLEFQKEMHRFLPLQTVQTTIKNPLYWEFLSLHMKELYKKISTS